MHVPLSQDEVTDVINMRKADVALPYLLRRNLSDTRVPLLQGKVNDVINMHKSEVKLLTGTVFSLKTSPEVSKSRTHRISADSLNELRAWYLSLSVSPSLSCFCAS